MEKIEKDVQKIFEKISSENIINSISVEEIIKIYPYLGIPHFQRGFVWGSNFKSALLESLFLDTPCGSFVFWKSKENRENGDPLIPEREHIEFLIVDGQQRIRSIYEILKGIDTEEEIEEDEDSSSDGKKGSRVWCLNLTKIPEFKDQLQPLSKDYSLFVYTLPPKDADEKSPLRMNVIPISFFFDDLKKPEYGRDFFLKLKKDVGDPKSIFESKYENLAKKMKQIMERKFPVVVKETDDKSEIVSLYTRINSGGAKVEAEERAFARLMSLHDKTYDYISEIFNAVHGKTSEKQESKLERDEVLKRKRERQFGFKLFIRTFIQACQYHSKLSSGKRDFSFDTVHRSIFQRKIKENKQKIEYIWKETKEAIVYVDNIIEEELNCDKLELLPESFSLLPVFQLLIQYPKLREEKYKRLISNIILRLLLVNENHSYIIDIFERIKNEEVCFKSIPIFFKKDLETQKIIKTLEKKLKESNSIQDHYVLLLYWLLRRNGIRDFSYKNVERLGKPKPYSQNEVLIDKNVDPQKQHIIPFSKLKDVLGKEDLKRTSNHPANNIGNITYISKNLNSYETGLGDEFIDLEDEPKENKLAHFLEGEEIERQYEKIKNLIDKFSKSEDSKNKGKLKDEYEKFCSLRRKEIIKGFGEWLNELDKLVFQDLNIRSVDDFKDLTGGDERIETISHILEDTIEDKIRALNYDNEVEDKIIYMIRKLKINKKNINDEEEKYIIIKLPDKKNKEFLNLEFTEDGIYLSFKRAKEKRIEKNLRETILKNIFNLKDYVDSDKILLYSKKEGKVDNVLNVISNLEEIKNLEAKFEEVPNKKEKKTDEKEFFNEL